jgi:hypothetical protein
LLLTRRLTRVLNRVLTLILTRSLARTLAMRAAGNQHTQRQRSWKSHTVLLCLFVIARHPEKSDAQRERSKGCPSVTAGVIPQHSLQAPAVRQGILRERCYHRAEGFKSVVDRRRVNSIQNQFV